MHAMVVEANGPERRTQVYFALALCLGGMG